ncbi:10843_t:CDS:2 [Rhizophagus irregularis]|nr:10843_t:CDS:2 [Rhizophagus irregularis]
MTRGSSIKLTQLDWILLSNFQFNDYYMTPQSTTLASTTMTAPSFTQWKVEEVVVVIQRLNNDCNILPNSALLS